MRLSSARRSRFSRSTGYRKPDFRPTRPRVSRTLTILRPADREAYAA